MFEVSPKIYRIIQWGKALLPIGAIIVIVGVNTWPKIKPQTQAGGADETKVELKVNSYENSFGIIGKYTGELVEPDATAESIILVSAKSGEVIYERDSERQLPPASIAKLMTAIVSLEEYGQDKIMTVHEDSQNVDGNRLIMRGGERIAVKYLLRALLMVSANDAAEVLAVNFPGGKDKFIEAMNEKAKQLGLTNSTFKNPSGLDKDGFVTSAKDMAILARLIYQNYPELLTIMGETYYEIPQTAEHEYHALYAISDLTKYKKKYSIIGVKNGYTSGAKRTNVIIAHRGGEDIILIYLRSSRSFSDAEKLLEWCDVNCSKTQ